MRLALLGLMSMFTMATSMPLLAADCNCDKQCQKICAKGEGKDYCKCKACDCAKTGKCKHGKCHHKDKQGAK